MGAGWARAGPSKILYVWAQAFNTLYFAEVTFAISELQSNIYHTRAFLVSHHNYHYSIEP